jgi:hypothetical protein
MSSVIGGMEDTIAQTMAQIGWPGADLVNEPEPEIEPEIEAAEPIVDDETAPEPEELGDEDGIEESPEGESEPADVETPAAEDTPAYRPKWKKAALAELDKLPPEVQQAFIAEDKRREENFHKGIEQYRAGNAVAKEWDEVITPYRATIDHFQVKPQEAVRSLLATDHVLRYGQPHQKIGTILQAMQNYGINPADLVAVVQGVSQQEPQDPQYQALNQRLSQFEQAQMAQQQAAEQARLQAERQTQTSIQSQIEAFASDPDHEHFDLLKPMMGGLLQTGQAKDLTEAYEMAFKAHPQTANIWIAQQQKQWADSRKAAASKAKQVTNVRSNGRASTAKPTTAATMEETIRLTAEKLGLA